MCTGTCYSAIEEIFVMYFYEWKFKKMFLSLCVILRILLARLKFRALCLSFSFSLCVCMCSFSSCCCCSTYLSPFSFFSSYEAVTGALKVSSKMLWHSYCNSTFKAVKLPASDFPLKPLAAVYVSPVITHKGTPFIFEMFAAKSGTNLNVEKYFLTNVCVKLPPSGFKSSMPEKRLLMYSLCSHAAHICCAMSSICACVVFVGVNGE